ncbi:MAG: hypothetical protein K5848_03845 [Lachnospiraceae bacterium]|nr:hypothetical protein [Lachnospiraceae bacterium]
MKIVYLGTDAYVSVFKYLLEKEEIMALYICGNDEDYFREKEIVRIAEAHGVPVIERTITAEDEEKFINEGCRLFFSADYGRHIPVPEDERAVALNIHASALPVGRSYCPVECAMEKRAEKTGVSIHMISEEFDCGDIIMQEVFVIPDEYDSVDVYLKCDLVAKQLTEKMMNDFSRHIAEARRQETKEKYWKIEHIKQARLSHDMTVRQAQDIYRIYNRMTRVKTRDGEVFYVRGIEYGKFVPEADELLLGDILIYRLADGHARIFAGKAEEEVWDAEKYPF